MGLPGSRKRFTAEGAEGAERRDREKTTGRFDGMSRIDRMSN
jgi:hypothetical protein